MTLINRDAFLVASADESIVSVPPYLVFAESKAAAILKYQREVRAMDEDFYAWVADRSVNASFAERFYLASAPELDRFSVSGVAATEPEIVASRIKTFFRARPELGSAYAEFLQTGDLSLLVPDLLAFIAASQTVQEHGMVAIEVGDILRLE